MHRSKPVLFAVLVVTGSLWLAACQSEPEPVVEETPAAEAPPPAEQATVAYAPTAEGELPAAILGTAPPPRGEAVNYMPDDAATSGYIAVPEGEGPFPALILVHEWDGLKDRVRQVADAMAAEGYIALAADLFHGKTGNNREENMALVQASREDPGWIVRNLNTAAQYLRNRPDVSGKIGVMGWCYGGGVALSYGLEGENHDATAMFYGQLVQDPERLKRLSHALYGTFAAEDSGIPPDEVKKFVDALRTAGIENDVHIYDDVGHGFWLFVDQEPETRRAPALDAWQRLKAYLSQTLGGNDPATN